MRPEGELGNPWERQRCLLGETIVSLCSLVVGEGGSAAKTFLALPFFFFHSFLVEMPIKKLEHGEKSTLARELQLL